MLEHTDPDKVEEKYDEGSDEPIEHEADYVQNLTKYTVTDVKSNVGHFLVVQYVTPEGNEFKALAQNFVAGNSDNYRLLEHKCRQLSHWRRSSLGAVGACITFSEYDEPKAKPSPRP